MKIGFVGLGKMGSRMALKILKEGHDVVVWNRSQEPINDLRLKIKDLRVEKTIEELVQSLNSPRVIWIMLPAEATHDILEEISKYLQAGDIVIDGGNAHYKDTEKRSEKLKAQNVKYLGIGVSGGLIAAEKGYPLMVGGDESAYKLIKPILDSLAKPNGGHEYFGPGGSGHFVKMIHNGIEYGIMQALGEGFEVLEKAPYKLDLLSVAKLWQKRTLVSGFMLDRVLDAFKSHPNLSDVSGVIDSTGEADWTIKQAKEEGVNVEIIERSVNYRKRSKTDPKIQQSFTAKLVAALREAFGGHEVKTK